MVQGPSITILGASRSSSQKKTSRDCVHSPVDGWWRRGWIQGHIRGSCRGQTLRILRLGSLRILVQVAQLDEIFDLILQMTTFIGVMPDVVMETTKLGGVSLCNAPEILVLEIWVLCEFYVMCVLD